MFDNPMLLPIVLANGVDLPAQLKRAGGAARCGVDQVSPELDFGGEGFEVLLFPAEVIASEEALCLGGVNASNSWASRGLMASMVRSRLWVFHHTSEPVWMSFPRDRGPMSLMGRYPMR